MRNYVKPVPLEVNTETHPPPELQEFEVILALFRIQKQLRLLLVTILGLERQLPKPSFCGDCSLEQVFVFPHMLDSTERS